MPGFEANAAEDRCAPLVCLLTMVRNCDLLLNYVRHRMMRIEQVGDAGSPITSGTSSAHVRARQARWQIAGRLPPTAEAKLSQAERTYAERYDELLSDLQMQYGLDLTRDPTPPTDNKVAATYIQLC